MPELPGAPKPKVCTNSSCRRKYHGSVKFKNCPVCGAPLIEEVEDVRK